MSQFQRLLGRPAMRKSSIPILLALEAVRMSGRVRRVRGARAAVRTGVVGSGWRGLRGRRAVRAVRAPVQQRVQPAPTRAPNPRGAAGGVRHLRPQLQDAAVPAPAHAGAAPSARQAAAAAAPRAAARTALPTVAAPRALSPIPRGTFSNARVRGNQPRAPAARIKAPTALVPPFSIPTCPDAGCLDVFLILSLI